MNLILLEDADFVSSDCVRLCDRRADHIQRVIRPEPGQSLVIGKLNGLKGVGQVTKVEEGEVELACSFDSVPPPRPPCDVMLALPRPQSLERLWPQLAAMGVGAIYLTNANKVERYYFDSHTLRPERYLPRLKEGLEQAKCTHLPEVSIHKRLKVLLEDGLPQEPQRLIADPGDASLPPLDASRRKLIAIGPEGGWTDYERDLLASYGFEAFSIGQRVLRSDTACIAALAVIQ